MNVDQAYEVFRSDGEGLREAVQWTLDHWDEAGGRLLSKLRSLCANLADGDREGGDALFYLVHLFAEKRDVRAYGPLCARLAQERDVDIWLGDAVSDTLPGVLIALYDGDLAPVLDVIDSRVTDEAVRGAALEAFGFLVRCENAMADDEARAVLRRVLDEAKPRERAWLWVAWALTTARLGFADLSSEAARLFSKHWIDDELLTIQEFHALLGRARAAPREMFADEGLSPFDSTVAMLDRSAAPEDEDTDAPATGAPHVNPVRDVGRNDPCPCGSGKKFKKCCLAA